MRTNKYRAMGFVLLATVLFSSTPAQAGFDDWKEKAAGVLDAGKVGLGKAVDAGGKVIDTTKQVYKSGKDGLETIEKTKAEAEAFGNYWEAFKVSDLGVQLFGFDKYSPIGIACISILLIFILWLIPRVNAPIAIAAGCVLGRAVVFFWDYFYPCENMIYTLFIPPAILLLKWRWCYNLFKSFRGGWPAFVDYFMRDMQWEPPEPALAVAGAGAGTMAAAAIVAGASNMVAATTAPSFGTCPACHADNVYIDGFCQSCGFTRGRTPGGRVRMRRC